MALTRITKGVIKPNENYDTHNINSTGIVTAIGLDVNGNGDISGNLSVGGVLTYEDVTSIDSVGIITAQKDIHVGAGVSAVGVGTFGSLDISGDIDVDGHTNLDNVSIAGVTTTTRLDINSTTPIIDFLESDGNPDYRVYAENGEFIIRQQSPSVSNRLVINSTGVSIPVNIDVSGELTVAETIGHTGDTHTKLSFPANDTIALTTGGTERARITSNGHLLLGTGTDYADSNSDDVQIYGTGDTGMSITSGTSHYGSIYFGDGTSGDSRNRGIVRYNHNNNSMELWANTSERLRIDQYGRLLVGTTTEGHANADNLTIATTDHTGITLRSATNRNGSVFFSDGTSGADEYRGWIQYTHTSDYLTFGTNGDERLRITNNGRVGINSTSPTKPLDVVGSAEISSALTVGGALSASGTCTLGQTVSINGTNPQLQFVDSNHNPDYSIYGSNGRFSVYDATNSAERFRISSTGKITHTYNGTAYDAQYGQFEIAKDGASNADPDWSYLSFHRIGQIGWQQGIDSNDFVIASTGGAAKNTLDAEKLRIDSSGRVIIGKVMTAGTGPYYDDITINNSNQSGSAGGAGIDLISKSDNYGAIVFSNESQHERGYIKFEHASGVNKLRFGTLGVDRWQIYSGGNLQPATDSAYDIGSTSVRVRNIYTDNFYATSLSYDGNTLKFGDGSGPSTTTYYNDIIIDNSNNASGASGGAGITLHSGSSSWCGLIFGDADAHQQGYVKYSNQNDYMNFGVGGSELIENGGSVGITSAIHHIGDTHTEFGFPSNDSFIVKVAGESRIYTHSNEAIWNRRDANAGITTQTMLINYNTAAGTGCAIGFAPSGVNYNARHSSIEVVNEGNNQMTMRFKVTDPSVNDHAVERMRINKDGKFCLGTFNANYASNDGVVSIVNAASSGTENPLLTLWNPTTVADARAGIDFLTNAQYGTSRDGAFIRGSNDGSTAKAHLQFGTIKDETYAETFRIQSDGNVVMGHTATSNRFQIGNTGHSGYAIATNSPSYGAVIQVGDGATPGSAAALWIRNLNNGGGTTALFRVQGDATTHFGNQTSITKYNDGVEGCSWYDLKKSWQQGQDGGIGWSMMYFNKKSGSDNRIMHFFNNGTTCGYINRVAGNNTTQFATSSDYRLKKDVVALPNGIERVKQLRPVAFKWKNNNGDMEGFLAHEAQEIVPYAVSGKKDEVATEDFGDKKKGDMIVQGVDYGEFTPLLTAAMKELIAKVETLEAEVAALKGS